MKKYVQILRFYQQFLLVVLSSALFTSVLSSCAVTLNLPTSRFDSPEAKGEPGKFRLDMLALEGNESLILTQDYTAQGPNFDNPAIERAGLSYRAAVGFSVLERADIDLKFHWNSPLMLQAKYQILGEPKTRASEGNVSLSWSLAAGRSSDQRSGSSLFERTTAVLMSTRYTVYDTGAILGYRISDATVAYGGPFYSYYSIEGERTLKPYKGTSTVESFSGSPRVAGVNLGVEVGVGPSAVFMLEYSYVRTAAGATITNESFAGAEFGFHLL